jgi:nitrogen-specific signal transduction histidine kinase/CheY-like chemotaxis protein
MENQLRQAQKMEAIGTLAGGIAHDFNNILGIILTNAELIKGEVQTVPPAHNEIKESAEEILLATTRARDLVRQILTFSRRTESRPTVIRVQPIVEECFKFLRSTIPAMVTIKSRIDPACSPIVCDPTQLHQIVMNLCTNAWHALPEKDGRLEIQVEEVDGSQVPDDRGIEEKAARYVCISVRDNGPGMPPNVQARIFEPFFTTKSPGEGTGLGLSVVHGIVKSNGGVITLESIPNKGTSFGVFFPVETAGTASVRSTNTEIVRGSGERILLVDDNVAFARGLERTLDHQGYKVEVCHSPRVGLDLFRKQPAVYDLVITDLSMPRMSGIELASHLFDIRPELPVILITGSIRFDEEQRAQLSENTVFLTKPVTPRDLSEAVNHLLHIKTR